MSRSLLRPAAASLLLLACRSVPSAPPAAAAPAVKQMRVNGVELAYVEQGSGTPVVFVHGSLVDWRSFEVVRPAIAARYRYVAYSRRYHQPNPWPGDGSDYSYQLHEEDLVGFVQALGVGPVHLVGHSYGAAVVALVALDHPEIVRSAVIAEPGSMFPDLIADDPEGKAVAAEYSAALAGMRAAARAGDLERSAELLIDYFFGAGAYRKLPDPARGRLLENVRTMGPYMAQRPAPKVTCATIGEMKVPVLAVRGERTGKLQAMTEKAFHRCLPPGNREAVIPNAGHAQHSANPAAYTAALLEFLAQHP